ncbi:DUF4817 domain-containing protein [Trichonephila clavipes]|nr:DUF4817 domain-containing protein [Trichonephila clavipes]
MLTGEQKAFCVLQFSKTESAVTVQRAFRIKFGCQPPNYNNIRKGYHQFETIGCLCKGKITTSSKIDRLYTLNSQTTCKVWNELAYQLDVCRVTNETRIEHL